MSQGNLGTLGWWLVAVVAHVVAAIGIPDICGEHMHGLSGLESSTLMLYVAVTLGLQFCFLHECKESAALVKKDTSIDSGMTLTRP